jgi:hypothetical protein
MVAVRATGSRFRSTEYDTVPLPVPCPPAVMTSQPALLVAVHVQCASVVTANVPLALSLLNDALPGAISMVHGSRPSWLTATACPATVKVPVRAALPVLAVRATVTVPFPVPFAPAVIDIHPRSDAVVHVQLAALAVTLTALDPPLAGNVRDDADSV